MGRACGRATALALIHLIRTTTFSQARRISASCTTATAQPASSRRTMLVLSAMKIILRAAVHCRWRRKRTSPDSHRCCAKVDRRRRNFVTAIIRSWTDFAVVSGARERRLEHRSHVIRRRRQTSIHGEASDRLDGPRATVRRALCGAVGRASPGYELLSVSSGSGGLSDKFGCGCRGAEATNPRTAREKAGPRSGACGWED